MAPGAPFPLAVAQITTRSRRAPAAAAGGPAALVASTARSCGTSSETNNPDAPGPSGEVMAHTRAAPRARGWLLSPDAAASISCTGSPGRRAAVGYAPGARTAPTTAWPAGTASPSVTIWGESSVPAGIGPRATWPTTAARSPAGSVRTPGPTSTSVVVTMSSPTVWPAATSWLATSTATRVEVGARPRREREAGTEHEQQPERDPRHAPLRGRRQGASARLRHFEEPSLLSATDLALLDQ